MGIKTLNIFPSAIAYPDRSKVIHLLEKTENVEAIFLNDIYKKRKWIKLRRKINEYKNINLIIHDHFISRGGFISLGRKKNTIRILSLYANNSGYFLSGKFLKKSSNNKYHSLKFIFHELVRALRILPREFLSIKISDVIIANSQEIIENYKKYGFIKKKSKTLVLPTSVDVNFWTPHTRGYRPKNQMLVVGRIAERKGIYDILKAFSIFNKSNNNYKLIFIGSPETKEQFDKVKQKIITLGIEKKVLFLGSLDRTKLKEYYQESKLLLFASYNEGSPRVIKEAASCACPVVTTNLSGITVLDPDNVTFLFFEPGDINKMILNITEIIKKNKTYSKKSHQLIMNNFTNEMVAGQLAEIYKDLTSNFL